MMVFGVCLLVVCCRGAVQFAHADDEDHLSLLQTHMHRRDTKKLSDEQDLKEPYLNVMQAQLNKLKSNMVSNKATHRKSMMMVGLESATPAKHTHLHNNATKKKGTKNKATKKKSTKNKATKKKAKREPKIDKFAEAAFAKSRDAKKMERAAMASIMDDEANEIAEDESHVLSAGALNRLEEVAEQVARSRDESEEAQKLEVDETHNDEHHHDHKGKKREDHKGKKRVDHEGKKREDKHEEEKDGEDPEAELVRLAHQRAQREEAKAQLAERAAKDAWVELEKFQAQRNIDASSIGAPVVFSVAHPGVKDKHHEWQGR